MRDLMVVIGVLLMAGWLLGLDFYSKTTSIQLMIGYVVAGGLLVLTRSGKKREDVEDISS